MPTPDPTLTGLAGIPPSPSATPIYQAVFDGANWRPQVGWWKFLNITTATTTTVKTGIGQLRSIIVNKGVVSATVTIYDNTSASGTKIGTYTFGAALLNDPGWSVLYDAAFSTGLTIVTSGATDLTVVYI